MQENTTTKEAIFSQIEKTMTDVFYLFNLKENRYEFMSANSEKITGAKPGFYYSGNDYVKTFVHPDDQESTAYAYDAIITKQAEQKITFRVVINNETRWVHEEFFPILNEVGEIIKISGVISDVTEEVKREAQLTSIQENTKLLSEIGHEIGEHLNVESIVKSIYNRLNKMLDAEIFGIGLVNEKENCIDFPYFLEYEVEMSTSMSLDHNVLAVICFKTNKRIVINNLERDIQKYTKKPLGKTTGNEPQSVLYFPLRSKDKVIGVITIQSRELEAYSKTDIDLLENISVYASRSLINANLYESLEQMVEERTHKVLAQKKELEVAAEHAALLSQMGTDLSMTLQFEEIFEKLHFNLGKLLDAEIFGVRILNKEEGNIDYKYEIESGKRDESITIPLTDLDNYTVWCVLNNKPIHINDNLGDYKKYVNEIKVPKGLMPSSLLFVPIVHDNEVLGAITVQSFKKNAYSKRHLDVMKTLAFYSGIAISNAALYRSLEKKVEERTLALKQANKSVMDSINYTKNIQDATLTKDKDIKSLLPESFVYFEPRDIVSGDFYRIDKLKSKKGDELISILVADCTGHGVPGATLAILCSSIIKQSYIESEVNCPGEALDFTRRSIVSLFENSDSTIYDGMDVALGVFNPKTYKFSFSGAFNNCYIVRDGEIIIIKGDRMHVGYSENYPKFTTQKIFLQPKDFVVFSTDGYLDQFGGENYKKFGRRQFSDMIIELQGVKPEHQHAKFNKSFKNWKADNEQTDDVCAFGFTVQ